MKAKKFIALAMSVAMAVGTASLLAACNQNEGGEGGETNNGTNTTYVEDTRIWYAVGRDTKGTLKDQGWDNNNSTYAFVRDTTVTNENVFTLSLDIYAGSVSTGMSFKFLYKTSADETNVPWTRQVGIHAFEGMDGYEGEGIESVIKIGGETVFTTASDNGDDGSNMALAKGQEGTYKFTLKTMSDTDTPKLSVERTAKIQVTHDMYLRGDMNNFSTQNMIAMTENIGEGETHTTWSAQYEVTAKDLWRTADGTEVDPSAEDATLPDGTGEYAALQIYNGIDSNTYVTAATDTDYKTADIKFNKNDYTVILLPIGNYTVEYDQVDNTVTIIAGTHKMHFIGAFNSWKEADADYVLTENNGIWTGTITIADDNTELKLFNALNGKYYTTPELTESDGNIKLNAGVYAFKFTEEGNVVEYEELGYWLVGTFVDPETDTNVNFAIAKDVTPKFVETAEPGVYELTLDFADITSRDGYTWIKDQEKPGIFAIQVVYGTLLCGVRDWNAAGDNQFIPTAGTWKITFDAKVAKTPVTMTEVIPEA